MEPLGNVLELKVSDHLFLMVDRDFQYETQPRVCRLTMENDVFIKTSPRFAAPENELIRDSYLKVTRPNNPVVLLPAVKCLTLIEP